MSAVSGVTTFTEAVVATSRWYKCDLQVATPAWEFQTPGGWNFRDKPSDRDAFADLYMETLADRGIEVIALADHHTVEWMDVMRRAGERVGITVFPGVEVTTCSGSDGVHLVIIGDRDAAAGDFEDLLNRVCGFGGPDHPRYVPSTNHPAPAPYQITQILDGLNDDWFALAPHALGENGCQPSPKVTT